MSTTLTENKDLWTEEEWRLWRAECKKRKAVTHRMIHYKSLVDNDISRRMEGSPENWGITVAREWVMRFKPIYDRMPENDYNNNILFICDEPLMRELFFSAFCRISKLVDYRQIDIMTIQDLWNGRFNKNNYFMDYAPEEIHSFEDLKEDVLCLRVTGSMAEVGKVPEIMSTVMSARSGKSGQIIKNQITWIYYQGTIDELRNSKFNLWESFFEKNGLIIDLNPQNKQNEFITDIYSPF